MLTSAIAFLLEAGRLAPSADNTQPWRFRVDGDRLMLEFGPREGLHSFPKAHPATLLAMGAVAENIAQAAAAVGIHMDIRRTASDESYFQFAVSAAPVSNSTLEAGRDHPLFGRHTNRFAYARTPLSEDLTQRLSQITEGSARLVVEQGQESLRLLARCVREASKIRFQTRENHEWFHASLRFSNEEVAQGHGLDIATLDLPPGGGLVLKTLRSWRNMALANRFGAHAFFAAVEAAPIARAPAILGLVAPSTREGALDAGRLMQRAWIEVHRVGLAAQPFYVVSEQLYRLEQRTVLNGFSERVDLLRGELSSVFRMRNETLHMLLRVGVPRRSPIRSRRVAVEDVLWRSSK